MKKVYIAAQKNWNISSEVSFYILSPLSEMHFKSIVIETRDAFIQEKHTN